MTTCLIVDDVTVTRYSARVFLEDLGVDVLDAEDGEKAINVLSKGNVNVILLDWHLKKKSGLDLLKVIRSEYGNSMKIVMFSGVEREDKTKEAIAAGANGYIAKPTTKEKIEAEFKRLSVI